MKKSIAVLCGILWLAGALLGRAEIIGAAANADGDNAVICTYQWDDETQTMSIVGDQYGPVGHIGTAALSDAAYFETDTELDPTVYLRTAIDNDMTFAWTGYHVNITMNKAFTVSSPVVYYPEDGSTSEPGWTGNVTAQAAQIGTTGVWLAQLDYTGGTPIAYGETLDFGYTMSFLGSVHYCQEMIPVPEPASLGLLACCMGALLLLRRKFARV